MNKVVLIHGNGNASGNDNWFPHLQAELRFRGIDCLAPDMPNPNFLRAEEWLTYLAQIGCDAETVLVGHSSGAVATMRYAERKRIAGSVLVGAYYTDLGYDDERESGFFDSPWDWPTVKENQEWCAVFASTDDPFIDVEEPRLIRDQLEAEYFEFNDRGHFGQDDRNRERFGELVSYLETKLG